MITSSVSIVSFSKSINKCFGNPLPNNAKTTTKQIRLYTLHFYFSNIFKFIYTTAAAHQRIIRHEQACQHLNKQYALHYRPSKACTAITVLHLLPDLLATIMIKVIFDYKTAKICTHIYIYSMNLYNKISYTCNIKRIQTLTFMPALPC